VILYKLFRIRPENGAEDPFDTNASYCLYDEPHGDYVYQPEWVEFVVNYLQSTGIRPAELRAKLKNQEYLDVDEYET